VWVVAVNAGISIIQNVQAVGEGIIAVQAARVVTLEAQAVRYMIEAGLRIKFIAQSQYAFPT
jgi:hypothetical protein